MENDNEKEEEEDYHKFREENEILKMRGKIIGKTLNMYLEEHLKRNRQQLLLLLQLQYEFHEYPGLNSPK